MRTNPTPRCSEIYSYGEILMVCTAVQSHPIPSYDVGDGKKVAK